jgi:hypothetical protein
MEDANSDCSVDQFETDPFKVDTDDDGIPDSDDTCRHPNETLRNIWKTLDADDDGIVNGDEDGNGNCELEDNETDPFVSNKILGTNFLDIASCRNPKVRPVWALQDPDGDVLKNGDEDVNADCEKGPFETDPYNVDTDGDGRDDFEDPCPYDRSANCLRRCDPDTSFADANKDSDGDGLKDVEEDSDKDCLFFGIQIQNGHGPEEPDPFDTSIYLRDSDGDGISDRIDGCQQSPEQAGFSPNINVPVSFDEEACAREQCLSAAGRAPGAFKDSDRDGLPDMIEDADSDCRMSSERETDRFSADTDGDQLPDGTEDRNKNGQVDLTPDGKMLETDPRNADSDADGLLDGVEDQNKNGRHDFSELNPRSPDTDGDGITDQIEDHNQNGLWDGGQLLPTGPCRMLDGEGNRILDANGAPLFPETSGYLKDSDLDGILDNKEDGNMNGVFTNIGERFKTNLVVIGGAAQPAGSVQEFNRESVIEFGESHPCDADTDGDGLPDGEEDTNGDGVLDWKNGETSPISPHTFGEPDLSRSERKLGMSGCSLIR